MTADLSTTNMWLGIIATVVVIEAVAFIALIVAAFMLFRRTSRLLADVEARHIGPAAMRVHSVLDDIKVVTTIIRRAAEGVDSGARSGLTWLFEKLKGAAGT
jgi:hypothetical protein